jgi:hypothetical protein
METCHHNPCNEFTGISSPGNSKPAKTAIIPHKLRKNRNKAALKPLNPH